MSTPTKPPFWRSVLGVALGVVATLIVLYVENVLKTREILVDGVNWLLEDVPMPRGTMLVALVVPATAAAAGAVLLVKRIGRDAKRSGNAFRGGIYLGRLWSWGGYFEQQTVVNPRCGADGAQLVEGYSDNDCVYYACPDCHDKVEIAVHDLESIRTFIARDLESGHWSKRHRAYRKELRRLASRSKSTI